MCFGWVKKLGAKTIFNYAFKMNVKYVFLVYTYYEIIYTLTGFMYVSLNTHVSTSKYFDWDYIYTVYINYIYIYILCVCVFFAAYE